MLYYCKDSIKLREFEKKLRARFNLELIGQAHWYLGTKINQLANYDIELDQSRYCLSIVKKYLDTAGTARNKRQHVTPIALDFIPTADDCSQDEIVAGQLEKEYNIDFTSCIGSLIYLGMTRCDKVYSVNKLAKFTRQPGRNHFEALLHLLRYLRDNALLGIRFYSDLIRAPLIETLKSQEGTMMWTLEEAPDVLSLPTWAVSWITALTCRIQLHCRQPKQSITKVV
jgi:hypothetical protein